MLSVEIVGAEPAIRTISHENISTIIVRTAVAASESVFLIPHFVRIAVMPAKNAEPKANSIHIVITLLSYIMLLFDYIKQAVL